MRKSLIFSGIAVFTLFSCEQGNFDGETNPIQEVSISDLDEISIVLDGEETMVYTDSIGEIFVLDENKLKSIKEFSSDGSPGFYISGDFEGYAIFSSLEKMGEIINSPEKHVSLSNKMNLFNSKHRPRLSSKGGTNVVASSLVPSVTIASAHSFGGKVFTKTVGSTPYATTYFNPHLRCNQYETDCINFNDIISSIRVVDATANFFENGFNNPGWWIYINALGTIVEINNLQDIKLNPNCSIFCHSFNDKITSFWVDSNFRFDHDFSGISGGWFTSCGHNYDDPQCP